jgi:membrane fusion protein, multidrug efflux system
MKEPPSNGPITWRWIAALVAVFLIGLAALAFRRPKGVPVQAVRAAHADLIVPVLCDGTLEPPAGGELRAPEAAIVGQILAAEGQHVVKGAPLVRLEAPLLAQQALEARSLVLQLAAESTQAATDLEDARRALEHQRRTLEADERLLKEKAITRAAHEESALKLRQAEERERSARARLDALAGARDGGASRVALAEASAAALEARLSGLTLRAPADGIVYGLPRKAREVVVAGQVVANVADPAERRLRTRVDQPDLPRIAAGQRLFVTFDGLPDRRFEGTVRQVSPGLREVAGREVGEVLGTLADPGASLPPNASVNVQIVTGERKNALVVPRAALYRDGGKRFVFVLDGETARKREISVGLVGLTDVEVTNGLAEKERVLLPGAVPLSDGLLVTVREG